MNKSTKARIEKMHPMLRSELPFIVNEANERLTGRAKVEIAQGHRTFEEQNKLYAQGRTAPGKIVTKAKGGQSIHNFALAVDIVLIIDGKKASWDSKTDWDEDKQSDWMEVVDVFKKYGWNWGGDWKSFKDLPHFEKTFGKSLSQLQKLPKDANGYVII